MTRLAVVLTLFTLGCSAPPASDNGGGGGSAGTASGGASGSASGGTGQGGASSGTGGQSGSSSGGATGTGGAGAAGGGGGGGAGGLAGTGGLAGASGSATGGSGGSGVAAGNGGGGAVAGAGGSNGGMGAGGAGGGVIDPGTEGDGDFMISSPFTPAPESTVGNGVPRGTMQSFMLASSASAIYPNNVMNGQAFNRQVQVYLPNGYVSGTEAPFMIVQDGSSYLNRLRPVLDNMIADGRLPKMIGIFINPGPGDGPGSQRGLEYDTVSDTYVRFIETEILPKVATDYGARFTTNPEGRASFGCSSGGAAAFTMGWFRPDLYRRIITYSGTFTNQASSTMYPHGAWEYHENLIPDNDPKPLRVFLEVGSNDNGSTSPASGFRNWVLANQGMARELAAKSYHYRFIFANGAGHCDSNAIAQTLPETMAWAWRGYPR